MRVNEFNDLQEFIDEYDYASEKDCEKHIGIEFEYKSVYYRVCREPLPEEQLPVLEDGRLGRYSVQIIHWLAPTEFDYELIGWYADMNSLLEDCVIDGRKFKDIIMDDDTRIDGKD